MIARVAVLGVALVVSVGGASGGQGRVLEPDTVTLASDVVSELPSAPVQARAAATWCGGATREDLAPNVVAGNPIHWIYAFPADGQDRMTEPCRQQRRISGTASPAGCRSSRSIPSPMACSIPNSIPLCTSFVKCPAPGGPACT